MTPHWKAESIQVAEAAKVIENTQRDVNIALINELAMIFIRKRTRFDYKIVPFESFDPCTFANLEED